MAKPLAVQTLGELVKIGDEYSGVDLATALLLNVDSVAATGSAIGDAAQLTTGVSIVTGADGTKAVKLPATPKIGELCIVLNSDESSALEIFPGEAGDSINSASAGAAFTVAAMGMFIAIATSNAQWYAAEPAVAAV